ncbi:TetR/AcrR family transcriptional regulator [Mameliella alba]|nr:TetR/AcrR family transcriptional regulator [Antarctobacter heliothermus]MBY6142839.1 TetR/AcrR family transcriptional regulator [Mameliella alba]
MFEAVEKGFAALSVADVVKRAQVSAGTIYVHFENKTDMLQQVYMELKEEFHATVTRGRDTGPTRDLIRTMWFDMFDWIADHPREFLFLDLGSAARLLTEDQQAKADAYAEDIAGLLQRGVLDGTLAPLDTKLLSLLLTAPAMQMARGAVMRGQPIPRDSIEQTFERVWLSIAA